MIWLEKLKILTALQKLPKNVGYLGKIIEGPRLWKVAQNPINRPIWSHCSWTNRRSQNFSKLLAVKTVERLLRRHHRHALKICSTSLTLVRYETTGSQLSFNLTYTLKSSLSLSISLFTILSMYLPIYQCIYVHIYLSIYLPTYLLTYQCICLPTYLSLPTFRIDSNNHPFANT